MPADVPCSARLQCAAAPFRGEHSFTRQLQGVECTAGTCGGGRARMYYRRMKMCTNICYELMYWAATAARPFACAVNFLAAPVLVPSRPLCAAPFWRLLLSALSREQRASLDCLSMPSRICTFCLYQQVWFTCWGVRLSASPAHNFISLRADTAAKVWYTETTGGLESLIVEQSVPCIQSARLLGILFSFPCRRLCCGMVYSSGVLFSACTARRPSAQPTILLNVSESGPIRRRDVDNLGTRRADSHRCATSVRQGCSPGWSACWGC